MSESPMRNIVWTVVALSALLVASCAPALGGSGSVTSTERPTPISISYQPDGHQSITSLDLAVSVVTKDLRRPSLRPQAKQYRTHQKIIDGVLYVRNDFTLEWDGKVQQRAVVTNGKDTFSFDPQDESKAERLFAGDNTVSRVPAGGDLSRKIPNLTATLQRLTKRSFQLRESVDHRYTSADWSGSSDVGPDKRLIKRSLQFDLVQSVLHSEQDVVVDSTGVQTITTTEFTYAETPVGPVVASKKTIKKVDYPYALDVSDRTLPRVDSLDRIAPISAEELATLKAQGALIYQADPLVGDPSDPDQTTETTETYSQITINQTDDTLFRLVH